MNQLMMLSRSADSWCCIVVANVQTMIIGHIEGPTLQPGLAVPHSKLWCQKEAWKKVQQPRVPFFTEHWQADWLVEALQLVRMERQEWRIQWTSSCYRQGFFSNSQNFRSCFWCLQYGNLLPTWNSLRYYLPDLVFLLVDSRFLCHVIGIRGAANDDGKNFPHEFLPFSVVPLLLLLAGIK